MNSDENNNQIASKIKLKNSKNSINNDNETCNNNCHIEETNKRKNIKKAKLKLNVTENRIKVMNAESPNSSRYALASE